MPLDVCSCKCSGDPHCKSYDGKWLHYQGACLYVLTQDQCVNGLPTGNTPNFLVVADMYRRAPKHKPVTWLFGIYVIFPGYHLVG